MGLQDAAKIQAANATLEVEFSAIRRICEVLEALAPKQRASVITYVSTRYQHWPGGEVELSGDLPDQGT